MCFHCFLKGKICFSCLHLFKHEYTICLLIIRLVVIWKAIPGTVSISELPAAIQGREGSFQVRKKSRRVFFCMASCWTRRAENDFGCAQWHKVRKKPPSTKPHTSQARWRIRGFDSSSPFVHPDCPSPLTLILYPRWIQQTLQGKKKMTKNSPSDAILHLLLQHEGTWSAKNHLLSLQWKLTNQWLREKATLAFYSHNIFKIT